MGQDLGSETFFDHSARPVGRPCKPLGGAADADAFWHESLRTGSRAGRDHPVRFVRDAAVSPIAVSCSIRPPSTVRGILHLMVYPSARYGDGALNANRPWLQELPDPVSKITWHSWVEMHPNRAEALGLRNGDVVVLSTEHGSVEAPVWTYPGIREDVIALPMGGGHTNAGRFADGNGVNALDLLPSEAEALSGGLVHFVTKVDVAQTGRRRPLASISGSDSQSNRPIAPAVVARRPRCRGCWCRRRVNTVH